jgi:hypothetical protein
MLAHRSSRQPSSSVVIARGIGVGVGVGVVAFFRGGGAGAMGRFGCGGGKRDSIVVETLRTIKDLWIEIGSSDDSHNNKLLGNGKRATTNLADAQFNGLVSERLCPAISAVQSMSVRFDLIQLRASWAASCGGARVGAGHDAHGRGARRRGAAHQAGAHVRRRVLRVCECGSSCVSSFT